MKYLIFTIACCGVLPAAFFAAFDRRLLKFSAFALTFLTIAFNATAINFFSHESYRGTSRGMEISILSLFSWIILLAIFLKHRSLKLVPDTGVFFYFLYWLTGVISMMNADNTLFSMFELWKMLMMYLLYLAVWNYLFRTGDFDTLFYGIGFMILCGFPVILFQKYVQGIYQVRGVFPHQNSMAMYMSLIAPFFLARLLNRNEKGKTWFFALVFAVAGISAVFSYSRGALVCLPIGCLITGLLSLFMRTTPRKMIIFGILGALAMTMFLLVIPRIVERFATAPKTSAGTRVRLALAAQEMMKDQPLGVGINNWGIKINPPYEYTEYPIRHKPGFEDYKDGIVETIYLLVGAECGYAGLLFLLGWFGFHGVIAIRLLRPLAGTPYFYLPAGACGGLCAAYLQSTLEWVLKQTVNFSELVVIFAILSFIWYSFRHRIPHGTPLPHKDSIQKEIAG